MKFSRRDFGVAFTGVTIGLFSSSISRRAFADDLEATLTEVRAARASLKTLKGPFTQERTIGLLATKVKSTGTLTMVRPDRLRWELAPPDEVVYWVGPDGFAYKNARSQGRIPTAAGKLAAAMEDVRLVLGGDLDLLRKRYDLALVSKTPDEVSFAATPKPGAGAAAQMQKILFSLGKDRATPTRATLVETERDKTDIVFGAMQRDVAIDPAFVRAPF